MYECLYVYRLDIWQPYSQWSRKLRQYKCCDSEGSKCFMENQTLFHRSKQRKKLRSIIDLFILIFPNSSTIWNLKATFSTFNVFSTTYSLLSCDFILGLYIRIYVHMVYLTKIKNKQKMLFNLHFKFLSVISILGF